MEYGRFCCCVVLLLLLLVSFSCAHPQCLDFQPPYKPSEPLKFCQRYSNYGCCNNKKDGVLKDSFYSITQNVNKTLKLSCSAVVKDLLCLQCHPYAAHVYDAEQKPVRRSFFQKRYLHFPGLCKNYCLKIFDQCKEMFLQLPTSNIFKQFVKQSSPRSFCSWAALPDRSYCYPDIKNFEKKQRELAKSYRNKICVKPYTARYFANTLVGVHSNDGTHRMFVGEQRGVVYTILPNGKTLEQPFLNITQKILNSGTPWDERGLLGLVFHPQYKNNGRFFVYYSASKEEKSLNMSQARDRDWFLNTEQVVRLSEFNVHPNDPQRADASSELILLEIDQPEPNHNGGMILFGEDGYLYVFVGDGGGSGDPHGRFGNGLLMSTLLGKVLRIDIDVEGKPYGIPKDNPFVNANNTKAEIYASGVRNPWRCSIDRGGDVREQGRIFCGDVGQNKFEEIDIIKKGKNYGWRAFEGFHCFDKQICETYRNHSEFPIIAYNHSVGWSIVGGYVYRGCNNPNLYGKYIFGDTMNGQLFVAVENETKWSYEQVAFGDSTFCNNGLRSHNSQNILSFGESEAGEVFILSTYLPAPNKKYSVVYQLVDPTRRGNPESCRFTPDQPKSLWNIKKRRIT